MKLVNEKASIFETCVRFANNFLFLPDIDITFDDCPSPRFGTMDNAAESVLGLDGRGHILRCVAWECTSLAVQLPISCIQCILFCWRLIDCLKVCTKRLSVLICHILHGITNLMHDAALIFSLRIRCPNRFFDTGQPIFTEEQKIKFIILPNIFQYQLWGSKCTIIFNHSLSIFSVFCYHLSKIFSINSPCHIHFSGQPSYNVLTK